VRLPFAVACESSGAWTRADRRDLAASWLNELLRKENT
jgi:hypothetical protein